MKKGIKIYNLDSGKFEVEKVPAESFMRFLYENPLGKIPLWSVFCRAWFSGLCGIWADSKASAKAVGKFITDNGIDASEFEKSPDSFRTFNDFFTRALRRGARPVPFPENFKAVSFPADGRHLLVENIGESDFFYIKGQRFNLASFLGDEKLARRFFGGTMLVSRLSPADYHRFHYPINGRLCARKIINGLLYSVSPIALVRNISILWENRRVLNLVDSPDFGVCAFVEIGATNVGGIVNFGGLDENVARGDVAGFFRFGGSCVATIFPQTCKIEFNPQLRKMSSCGMETYARVNSLAGILQV